MECAGPLPVDEYVETVVAETTTTEEAVEELIIGLVQDLDVEETRRAQPTATPPQT